jgi:two-component system sensor histidine kinase CreC
MRNLLTRVVEDARQKIENGSLNLALEIEDCDVSGDPLMLRQAIGNLLDNAIEFAPRGSTLRIAAIAQGASAVIEIDDEGPGIPDYAASRIFERFYSLPRGDGAKSTGLGLPFVREVCTLHGGSVDVANLPGGGARATVTLPRA